MMKFGLFLLFALLLTVNGNPLSRK